MHKPPVHTQEEARLNIVRALNILDTKPEERFDKLTKLVAKKLQAPISTITIIDKNREWFKSSQGLTVREMPRETSFCAHALHTDDIFIVEDTLEDLRFANNPQVKAHHPIRFYAGINLKHKQSGMPIGVLCIKDFKPRKFTPSERKELLELAKEAEYQLNMEKNKRDNNR